MRMSRPFVSLNERQRIIPLPLSSSRLQRKMVRRLPKACRRLPVCCIADFQSAGLPYYPAAWDHSKPCRLEVGDTAGWKPAVRFVPQTSSLPYRGFPNPQDFPITRQPGIIPNPADWKSATQQVGNLRHVLCRRLPVCRIAGFQTRRTSLKSDGLGLTQTLPTGSRRHSRLETCGMLCAADFQSAVSRVSNPQDFP